jgi:hypothetical protein
MSLDIVDVRKRGSVMCTCESCGVEFKKKRSNFNKSNRHFCSHECKAKGQITRVKCTCETCGVEFEKVKSQFEAFDRHFCSYECMVKGHIRRVKCTCENCGIEFEKVKSQFEAYDRHFCSSECRVKGQITRVKCTCETCGVEFEKVKSQFEAFDRHFCSGECKVKGQITRVKCTCANCGVEFEKEKNRFVRADRHFCSRKCFLENPVFSPRSKFEIALEEIIRNSYPNEEIIINDRKVLKGYEIDLYFPRVRLGVEVNGPVHYKDIYGKEQLDRIKRNDKIKRNRARRRGITIRTINISGSKSGVNSKKGKKALEDAVSVIKGFL